MIASCNSKIRIYEISIFRCLAFVLTVACSTTSITWHNTISRWVATGRTLVVVTLSYSPRNSYKVPWNTNLANVVCITSWASIITWSYTSVQIWTSSTLIMITLGNSSIRINEISWNCCLTFIQAITISTMIIARNHTICRSICAGCTFGMVTSSNSTINFNIKAGIRNFTFKFRITYVTSGIARDDTIS